MFLASVKAGVIAARTRKSDGGPSIRTDHEGKERSYLFVAATQARDHLIVTSYWTASEFLGHDESAYSWPLFGDMGRREPRSRVRVIAGLAIVFAIL